MPIEGEPFKFNYDTIVIAPDDMGVYALYNDDTETIYIGKALDKDGIKGQLQQHKMGKRGPYSKHATFFSWEICNNPSEREEELLQEHQLVYGSLPVCNRKIEWYC